MKLVTVRSTPKTITRRPARAGDDDPIVPPPSTMTVEHEYKPVLWLNEHTCLVRRAGF